MENITSVYFNLKFNLEIIWHEDEIINIINVSLLNFHINSEFLYVIKQMEN